MCSGSCGMLPGPTGQQVNVADICPVTCGSCAEATHPPNMRATANAQYVSCAPLSQEVLAQVCGPAATPGTGARARAGASARACHGGPICHMQVRTAVMATQCTVCRSCARFALLPFGLQLTSPALMAVISTSSLGLSAPP